jgi:hypothetical protein
MLTRGEVAVLITFTRSIAYRQRTKALPYRDLESNAECC